MVETGTKGLESNTQSQPIWTPLCEQILFNYLHLQDNIFFNKKIPLTNSFEIYKSLYCQRDIFISSEKNQSDCAFSPCSA